MKLISDYIFIAGAAVMCTIGIISGYYYGVVHSCEVNDGVYMGPFNCVLNKCMKGYDVYKCSNERFAIQHPWNISDVIGSNNATN